MHRQHFSPVGLDHVPVVSPAANFQVRREQREEPQLGEQLRVGLQAGMDEYTVLMGVGDNFFDDPVATVRIDVDDSIAQRAGGQALVGVVQVSFVAKKRLSIRDKILQIANLRPIDGRIVNLVEDAFGDRKPNPAQIPVQSLICCYRLQRTLLKSCPILPRKFLWSGSAIPVWCSNLSFG